MKSEAVPLRRDVFVLGTIHHLHASCEGYTFAHVRKLLEAYGPDLVCLEIRPHDLAAAQFGYSPPEMTQVVLPWAEGCGVSVAGIDWWEDSTSAYEEAVRRIRATDEGRAVLERMEKAERDIYGEPFERLCGTYRGANSPEVQARFRSEHQLEAQVLREGLLTKHWAKRNDHMARLVTEALIAHDAHRAIVVTGCEHKYAIEERLADLPWVHLVQLEDFLTGELTLDPEEQLDSERLFIFQKVESPQANTDPDSVDLTGVAEKIEQGLSRAPGDAELLYYRGLYHYMTRDYDKALADFEGAAAGRERLVLGMLPLAQIIPLRLGQMYDLLGRRHEAIEQYGLLLTADGRFARRAQQLIEKPFTRPGKASTA